MRKQTLKRRPRKTEAKLLLGAPSALLLKWRDGSVESVGSSCFFSSIVASFGIFGRNSNSSIFVSKFVIPSTIFKLSNSIFSRIALAVSRR